MIKYFNKNKFQAILTRLGQFSVKTFSTEEKKLVKFKFVYLGDKKEVPVEALQGQHILEIAHKYDVDLEGACDASLACSTCHVILEKEIYDSLPPAQEEEEDLLDLAFGLSETSRLGCQTIITSKFEGTSIFIPSATRNLYVDGKKPAKH
jgi:ferredoxin